MLRAASCAKDRDGVRFKEFYIIQIMTTHLEDREVLSRCVVLHLEWESV